VVGGANLPRPPIEPNFPQAVHSAPNVPALNPLPTGAGESPYYFLNDFSAPNSAEHLLNDAANFRLHNHFNYHMVIS
jgi:cysteine desulfurase/selenocysteine lyase